MASTATDDQQTKGTTTTASKLESLSRDDLIKLVKKSTILQKQTKGRNEELVQKLSVYDQCIKESFKIEIDYEANSLDETKVKFKQLADKFQENSSVHELIKEKNSEIENLKREVELNKSILEMLNNEIKILEDSNNNRHQHHYHKTKRKTVISPTITLTTPDIIIEEDDETATAREVVPADMEDMTFYIDELKSELEAEREKSAEYNQEILSYKQQIEDFEDQLNNMIKDKEACFVSLLDKFNLDFNLITNFDSNNNNNNSNNVECLFNILKTSLCEKFDDLKSEVNQISAVIGFSNGLAADEYNLEKYNQVIGKIRETVTAAFGALSGKLDDRDCVPKDFKGFVNKVLTTDCDAGLLSAYASKLRVSVVEKYEESLSEVNSTLRNLTGYFGKDEVKIDELHASLTMNEDDLALTVKLFLDAFKEYLSRKQAQVDDLKTSIERLVEVLRKNEPSDDDIDTAVGGDEHLKRHFVEYLTQRNENEKTLRVKANQLEDLVGKLRLIMRNVIKLASNEGEEEGEDVGEELNEFMSEYKAILLKHYSRIRAQSTEIEELKLLLSRENAGGIEDGLIKSLIDALKTRGNDESLVLDDTYDNELVRELITVVRGVFDDAKRFEGRVRELEQDANKERVEVQTGQGEQRVVELEEKLRLASSENEGLRESLDENEKRVQKLGDELSAVKGTSELETELNNQLQIISSENVSLKQKLEINEKQVKELEDKLHTSDNLVSVEREKLENALGDFNEQRESFKKREDDICEDLENSKQTAEALKTENENLRNRLEENEKHVKKLQDELSAEREKQTLGASEIEEKLNREIQLVSSENVSLREKLEMNEKRFRELEDRLNASNDSELKLNLVSAEKERLESRIKELEGVSSEFTESFKKREDEIRVDLKNSKQAAEVLKSENESLRSSLSRMEQFEAALNFEVEKTKRLTSTHENNMSNFIDILKLIENNEKLTKQIVDSLINGPNNDDPLFKEMKNHFKTLLLKSLEESRVEIDGLQMKINDLESRIAEMSTVNIGGLMKEQEIRHLSEREKLEASFKGILKSFEGVDIFNLESIRNSCDSHFANELKQALVKWHEQISEKLANLNEVDKLKGVLNTEKENFDKIIAKYDNFNKHLVEIFTLLESSDKLTLDVVAKINETDSSGDALLSNAISQLKSLLVKHLSRFEQEKDALSVKIKQQESIATKLQTDLERSQKDSQKSNVMQLELADYDRTINNLNTQLTSKDKLLTEAKQEIASLNAKVTKLMSDVKTMEDEKHVADEKQLKLKQMIVKAKKELNEAKTHETEHISQEATLRAQIEKFTIEIEGYKLQMVDAIGDKQKSIDKYQVTNSHNLKKIAELEKQKEALEQELNSCKENHDLLKSEYENYKVRVQHAFKKQKEQQEPNSGTNSLSVQGSIESLNKEISGLKSLIDQLKEKLGDSQMAVNSLEKEKEMLQDELERALERYTKLISDTKANEVQIKQKYEDMIEDNRMKYTEFERQVEILRVENETLKHSHKDSIKEVKLEQYRLIDLLQTQLEEARSEIKTLKERENDLHKVHNDLLLHKNQSFNDSPSKPIPTPLQLSSLQSPRASLVDNAKLVNTFEQLLDQKHQEFDRQSIRSTDGDQEVEALKEEILKLKIKLEHLTELLNESETNNLRLTEQINLLKEEIRRLERNQEREKSISNLEYLKNVVYKYLTFQSTQEKQQLLPVLCTILKLSQDEQATLSNSLNATSDSAAASSSWTSYVWKK